MMESPLLELPQRRPVRPDVELFQARNELFMASRIGGIRIIHRTPRVQADSVRKCPLLSAQQYPAVPAWRDAVRKLHCLSAGGTGMTAK